LNRRGFLQASTATAASAAAVSTLNARPSVAAPAQDQPASKPLLKRTLGKTGVDVTILNLGTWRNPGLDRLLRFAYAHGVRYFDTAKSYGSEPGIKRWFQQAPEVRDQIFLVTKDTPREPKDLLRMVDERCQALGTDHIDLFFIHALGDRNINDGVNWPKSPELGRVIEQLKNSGKTKFVGFSTHHPERHRILQSAAEGNFVDAIMLQYTPWLDKDSPLNKALDACHAKNIGLISMKQVAGQFNPGGPGGNILDEVPNHIPTLKERNLSVFQGLLHGIWSDERIASACVSMRNTDEIRANADAARRFEPLKEADIRQLRDASHAHGMTLCADCDGRCSLAAGTTARLGDLTRFLTYYEHHGYRGEARRLYRELADAERAWPGADLVAAREACPNHLDFAMLLPRADEHLA
jgi:aryl-alcohol dehydrogenase-like predicted oxidoreductase